MSFSGQATRFLKGQDDVCTGTFLVSKGFITTISILKRFGDRVPVNIFVNLDFV